MTEGVMPTDEDGDWVYQALEGLAPLDGLDSIWEFQGVRDHEQHAINKYKQKGTNLVVLVAINPLQVKDAEEGEGKRVSYHVTICREKDGKIKKPNQADISRARRHFFLRDLTPEERAHEGTVGDSRAHHIMAVVNYGGPKIAKPGGGFF